MNDDLLTNLTGYGSAPFVIAGLVVMMVVRKIVMGLMLLGFGLALGAVAFFVSQQ